MRVGPVAPICGLAVIALLSVSPLGAQDRTVSQAKKDLPATPSWLAIPYIFNTETWETAIGIGGGGVGWPNPHTVTYAAVTGSSNESWNVVVGGVGYPGLVSERLFVDPMGVFSHYTNLRVYVPGNEDFLADPARAGSHDSDPDNFFRESASGEWVQAQFRYVLPLGGRRESPLNTYVVNRGMLVEGASGGDVWNPLESGMTSILFRPYYRSQDVSIPALGDSFTFETLNFQLAVEYDNRDFRSNPSRGSYQKIGLTRDWGGLGESKAWTFGELELAKYFSLGSTGWLRQQVIGLNFWTGHSFTWEEVPVEGAAFLVAENRPPYFTGATLGGLDRMRGYPTARFNGRSVVYYSAEYRVIPEWSPFAVADFDDMVGMDWWQIGLFAEAGRVADEYDLSELYTDMKYDVGFDLRFMIRKAVVRIGVAVSDEAVQTVAMFGHPF